jgi:hypothetical protein
LSELESFSPNKLRRAKVFHRLGTALFDQQMWCWGRDVLYPGGNLLIRRGFTRCPKPIENLPSAPPLSSNHSPRPPVSASGYVQLPSDGPWIGLWGWGMLFGQKGHGTILLRRFRFNPVLLDNTEIPLELTTTDNQMTAGYPTSRSPENTLSQLFAAGLTWIAQYEEWVQQHIGLEYREACVAEWFKKSKIPADQMVAAWHALAKAAESYR